MNMLRPQSGRTRSSSNPTPSNNKPEESDEEKMFKLQPPVPLKPPHQHFGNPPMMLARMSGRAVSKPAATANAKPNDEDE